MNRLGWIHAPERSRLLWDRLTTLAAAARADGFDRTLVCGMGGSSLTPEVLAATAGGRGGTDGGGALRVLDSTDPAAVLAARRGGELARTLFLIISKSGTTIETLAFYHYFAALVRPNQFVAVTGAGTPLETLARARGFRDVLEHPGDVGGRYAALTVVGMLPAALLGLDGRALLQRTRAVDVARAKAFGAALADAALAGRDKLVLRPPPALAALAPWIEQLIAESSGKDGRGVVPVVDDPVGAPLHDAEVVT